MEGKEGLQLTLGERQGGGKYRFFLVDDSDFMLKVLARLVTSLDAEVVGTAADGEEAIRIFPQIKDRVDIVTLDITMPKLNGIDTLKRLLEIEPKVRVIMVSAIGHEEAVKQAVLLGAKHYIVKPFKREDLHRVFKMVLAR